MTERQMVLLKLIRDFTDHNDTDLEACLNTIYNHAAKIKELQNKIKELSKAGN